MAIRRLNIVDDSGEVAGEDTRDNIHKNGLLHREVHVWFYTPRGEIIFQRRSKTKDTFPDLLDATVGGHVEIGSDYEGTALKEIQEESGVKAFGGDLTLLEIARNNDPDEITGTRNNSLRAVYAYRYSGKMEDLKVEEEDGAGFEAWPIEKIFDISEAEKKRFVPGIIGDEILELFRRIKNFSLE